MDKNPFSLYDSLGYVFPGAFSILIGLFILFLHQNQLYLDIDNTQLFLTTLISDFSWDGSLIYILSSYIVGHLVAYSSSLTIEPYSVWRYGYPSKFMVRDNVEKNYFSVQANEKKCAKFFIIIWKILVGLMVFPVTFCDLLFGKCLSLQKYYVKKLDKPMVENIEKRVKQLYEKMGFQPIVNIKDNDTDFFRIVYHYEYEKKTAHCKKMDNYVALYGFMRALSFIAVLCFFVSAYITWTHWNYIEKFDSVLWCCFMMLLSFFLFMSFMKFYRRYTLEGLMCLITDQDIA